MRRTRDAGSIAPEPDPDGDKWYRTAHPESVGERLISSREMIMHRPRIDPRGWNEVADDLVLQNQVELAQAVRRFVARMPPPQTEKEIIRARFLKMREKPRVRDDRELTH